MFGIKRDTVELVFHQVIEVFIVPCRQVIPPVRSAAADAEGVLLFYAFAVKVFFIIPPYIMLFQIFNKCIGAFFGNIAVACCDKKFYHRAERLFEYRIFRSKVIVLLK